MARCPLCGATSRRIHSRYIRHVADLPCAGKQVGLRVITRRFVCGVALLADREVATVRAWLSGRPEIKIVSRDRGGGYGKAATKALFRLSVGEKLASWKIDS